MFLRLQQNIFYQIFVEMGCFYEKYVSFLELKSGTLFLSYQYYSTACSTNLDKVMQKSAE